MICEDVKAKFFLTFFVVWSESTNSIHSNHATAGVIVLAVIECASETKRNLHVLAVGHDSSHQRAHPNS